MSEHTTEAESDTGSDVNLGICLREHKYELPSGNMAYRSCRAALGHEGPCDVPSRRAVEAAERCMKPRRYAWTVGLEWKRHSVPCSLSYDHEGPCDHPTPIDFFGIGDLLVVPDQPPNDDRRTLFRLLGRQYYAQGPALPDVFVHHGPFRLEGDICQVAVVVPSKRPWLAVVADIYSGVGCRLMRKDPLEDMKGVYPFWCLRTVWDKPPKLTAPLTPPDGCSFFGDLLPDGRPVFEAPAEVQVKDALLERAVKYGVFGLSDRRHASPLTDIVGALQDGRIMVASRKADRIGLVDLADRIRSLNRGMVMRGGVGRRGENLGEVRKIIAKIRSGDVNP